MTRGLHDRFGEDIIRDGPLCESATVGFGIGLAVSGVRAVVEIEFFDFVGVAMDQIFNQAAKLPLLHGRQALGSACDPHARRLSNGNGPAALPES